MRLAPATISPMARRMRGCRRWQACLPRTGESRPIAQPIRGAARRAADPRPRALRLRKQAIGAVVAPSSRPRSPDLSDGDIDAAIGPLRLRFASTRRAAVRYSRMCAASDKRLGSGNPGPSGSGLGQALADGEAGELDAVVNVELGHQVKRVLFDGLGADPHELGDFLVEHAAGDVSDHLQLAPGQ